MARTERPLTSPAAGPKVSNELRWAWAGTAEAGLVFLGALALTLAPLTDDPTDALAGIALLAGGLALFAWEARHRPAPEPSPLWASPGGRWWKHPTSTTGRYLCVSCGWRQEEPATFCPRCRKVLVRLPPPPGAAPPGGDPGRER